MNEAVESALQQKRVTMGTPRGDTDYHTWDQSHHSWYEGYKTWSDPNRMKQGDESQVDVTKRLV